MYITLTVEEFGRAIYTAYERWSNSVRSNRTDLLMEKTWEKGFNVHLYGAIGEIAAAKAIGCYAPLHVNQFSRMRADLLCDVEVRHRISHEHQLIVREKDMDERKYVLTRGTPPNITVVGWLSGREAKSRDYLRDYGDWGPAYFVPDERLHSMDTLK